MTLEVKISHIMCIFAMVLATPRLTLANVADVQQLITSMEQFGNRLFTELVNPKEYANKNIVFSPLSIHTCLSMVRMGAECETASQMDRAFGLPPQDTKNLAVNYNAVLSAYQDSTILKMANKMYAMLGFKVQEEFNELLTQQFNSAVEFLNFANSEASALTINRWVEQRTNNLIRDLIKPGSLDASTRLVLVNAIHFKGNWVHQFPEEYTQEKDFYLDDVKKTRVPIMNVKKYFNYTTLPGLDAAAVELPYKDGDLAMLVLLPNKRTGLADLENKLKYTPLSEITNQMTNYDEVSVYMPKFKAEFESELLPALSKIGLERIFSEDAEFGKMLIPDEGVQVSSVVHKAFIEVNERGTEAAAATEAELGLRFGDEPIFFVADRPFHFIIKNAANLVVFKGSYKNNS